MNKKRRYKAARKRRLRGTFSVVHARCGRTMFHLRRRPSIGEPMRIADVVTTTGRLPRPGETIACACGLSVATADIHVGDRR